MAAGDRWLVGTGVAKRISRKRPTNFKGTPQKRAMQLLNLLEPLNQAREIKQEESALGTEGLAVDEEAAGDT